MPKKVGEISGEFHTLFASYTFIQGGYKEKHIKIQWHFLKRGDDLILGNGEIQITLGASHFVNDAAIDFDRVKYKFTAECVDEKIINGWGLISLLINKV
jgi:hypothetical protein